MSLTCSQLLWTFIVFSCPCGKHTRGRGVQWGSLMQMNGKERKSMQMMMLMMTYYGLKADTSTLKIVIVPVVQYIIARSTSVTLRGSSISSRVSQKTACSEFFNWQARRCHKQTVYQLCWEEKHVSYYHSFIDFGRSDGVHLHLKESISYSKTLVGEHVVEERISHPFTIACLPSPPSLPKTAIVLISALQHRFKCLLNLIGVVDILIAPTLESKVEGVGHWEVGRLGATFQHTRDSFIGEQGHAVLLVPADASQHWHLECWCVVDTLEHKAIRGKQLHFAQVCFSPTWAEAHNCQLGDVPRLTDPWQSCRSGLVAGEDGQFDQVNPPSLLSHQVEAVCGTNCSAPPLLEAWQNQQSEREPIQ